MIRLENFNETFYENLINWISNEEELMQFAGPGYNFPLTANQLNDSLKDSRRYVFAVVDAGTNTHIGHCELYLREESIHLGRILIGDKQKRGRGIGQQVVLSLLEFGFTTFEKTLAELNVFDWNVPAIECYKRVGFTINPGKRLERKINGKTWTILNMTLNKSQWSKNRILL